MKDIFAMAVCAVVMVVIVPFVVALSVVFQLWAIAKEESRCLG